MFREQHNIIVDINKTKRYEIEFTSYKFFFFFVSNITEMSDKIARIQNSSIDTYC